MQLLSAIVRRYRVHLELSVDFDPARTLLGGPNEVGKSTLIEAIHRALFLKARITGAARDSMLRLPHDGAPEVELQFRAAGRTYRLQKRFAGTNGSTWLRDDAGVALQGEEAESRLAEILGVEARNGGPGARNRAFQQWAHLWVWQGKAGDDPAEPIAAEQSRLLQRLQAMGGAAALQSDRDARVARHFAKARDSIFTQQGQPKAGSELHRAEQALAGAESERTCAAERVQRLEQTAADLESASRDLAAAAQSLQRLRQEQQQVDARLQQLARLRVQETEQRQAAATAAQHHAALETANRQILTTRTELGAVEQALAPKSEQLRQLEQARDQDRRRLAEADARSRGCNDAARLARLRHELASAQSTLFEKTALHARLTDKARTIAERRDAIAALEGELANLPAITRTKLERIQRLETNCSTAAAALQAMAAEIEVLASDQPALIGDDAVPVGQSRILTADTEVRLGEAIRLRIRPGGGTSLAAARAARDDAQRKLQNALDGLGLASVQAAREAQARRDELTSRLEQTRAELAGLGADHFDDEFQAAQAECAGAKGTVDRLQALVPGAPLPSDKAAADAQASAAREALREAETADAEARSTRDACAVALDARDDDLARRRQELETQQRQRNDLQAQQRLLLQTHGPDEARAEALAQSQTTRTTAETALRLTREAIEALQPDLLETDRVRLARALEQKTSEHTEAGKRQAIALGALRSDGAEDPQAALAEAQARARAATEVRDTERRRAQAIDRLHQLFLDEQRTLAAQFTQPLADKISGYLRCLFGPDARAGVTLEDSQFTGVRLFPSLHRRGGTGLCPAQRRGPGTGRGGGSVGNGRSPGREPRRLSAGGVRRRLCVLRSRAGDPAAAHAGPRGRSRASGHRVDLQPVRLRGPWGQDHPAAVTVPRAFPASGCSRYPPSREFRSPSSTHRPLRLGDRSGHTAGNGFAPRHVGGAGHGHRGAPRRLSRRARRRRRIGRKPTPVPRTWLGRSHLPSR
ncbi:MAG: AAA family ATPase [Verrucomicrobia bacterium]|nr:AAA family ATPase [Verrucomicrobiota bacterium]